MLGNVSLKMPDETRLAAYAAKNEPSEQKKPMVLRFETSDGKKGELQRGSGILASVGGAGGTVNAKYHESSTAEDPVVVVWGTDSDRKEYQKIVHLNDVDPGHATPAEMIALNAHLSKTSGSGAENPIALWASKSAGVNSGMDYVQYYKEYIAMQQQSGNPSGAELYQLQLERFLFYHQQQKTMLGL